jgi:hypothetical protein
MRSQSPFHLDGEQPLFSGAEEEQINTVPSVAGEVPHGRPADCFEHDLCHRLGDVSGDAAQRALPPCRTKCSQGVIRAFLAFAKLEKVTVKQLFEAATLAPVGCTTIVGQGRRSDSQDSTHGVGEAALLHDRPDRAPSAASRWNTVALQ